LDLEKEVNKLELELNSERAFLKDLKKAVTEKESNIIGLKIKIEDLKEKIRLDNLRKGK